MIKQKSIVIVVWTFIFMIFTAFTVVAQTDGKTKFVDEEFGITFEYPEGWQPQTLEPKDGSREIVLFNNLDERIYIHESPKDNSQSLEVWFKSEQAKGYYSDLVTVVGQGAIGNYPLLVVGQPATCQTIPLMVAILQQEETFLTISYHALHQNNRQSSSAVFSELIDSLLLNPSTATHQQNVIPNLDFPKPPDGFKCEIQQKLSLSQGNTDMKRPQNNVPVCPNADMYFPTTGQLDTAWGCIDHATCPSYRSVNTGYFGQPHRGLDIFGSPTPGVTPVYATYDGVVHRSGNYSVYITFDGYHSGKSAYMTHMGNEATSESYIKVAEGERVFAGVTEIGRQGNGGTRVTHLHISYLNNPNGQEVNFASNTLDPTPFLKADGLVFEPGWQAQPFTDQLCIQPNYAYEIVRHTESIQLAPTQQEEVEFIVRNIGTKTWHRDEVKLGTDSPRDHNSELYQEGLAGWLSANRIAMETETVVPGDEGTFRATIIAPEMNKIISEKFRLVAEGIEWLSGPEIQLEVTVSRIDPEPLPLGQRGEDYKYEQEPDVFVCNDGGLVGLQADSNGSHSEVDFHVQKCDGGPFQQDGTAKLISNGQTIAEMAYQAGVAVISFEDLDPYESHNLIGRNTYVVEIYSADQPGDAKLTGPVQAFTVPNSNPNPLTPPYEYEASTGEGRCLDGGLIKLAMTSVPDQPKMTAMVSKCDDGPFVENGKAVLMVNGMVLGEQSYNAGDAEIRFENLNPNHTYNLLGRNSYQVQVFSADQPEDAKLSGIIEAWPKPVARTSSTDPINYSVSEDNLCGREGLIKLGSEANGATINLALKKCDDTPFQQDGIAYLLANNLVIAHQAYNAGIPSLNFTNLDPLSQYDLPAEVDYQVQLFSADNPVHAKLTGITKINAVVEGGTQFVLEPAQSAVKIGDTVQVKAMVYGAVDMYALQAACSVDPARLAWKTVAYNELLANALEGANDIDASQENWFGALSLKHPASPVTADGMFATFKFEALAEGDATIHCEPLGSDQNGNPITLIAQDTSISVESIDDGKGGLHGIIYAQGRSNHVDIEVTVDGPTSGTAQTNEAGQYSFTTLGEGSYNIEANAVGYLPSCTTASVIAVQSTEVALTKLAGGDLDDNGEIRINDATLLGSNLNLSATSTPAMDARSDINADGQVNVQDLAILGGNFGKSGCQGW